MRKHGPRSQETSGKLRRSHPSCVVAAPFFALVLVLSPESPLLWPLLFGFLFCITSASIEIGLLRKELTPSPFPCGASPSKSAPQRSRLLWAAIQKYRYRMWIGRDLCQCWADAPFGNP